MTARKNAAAAKVQPGDNAVLDGDRYTVEAISGKIARLVPAPGAKHDKVTECRASELVFDDEVTGAWTLPGRLTRGAHPRGAVSVTENGRTRTHRK